MSKPYKTAWRVQVYVLHTWKIFTTKFGEAFDIVLSDFKVRFLKLNFGMTIQYFNKILSNVILIYFIYFAAQEDPCFSEKGAYEPFEEASGSRIVEDH